MKEERTLILIKPDGLVKSLTGNIISMLSEAKLKIVGAKIVKVSKELAEKHYGDLKNSLIKKFGEEKGKLVFENTLEYLQGKFHTDRVLAMVYKGKDAVKKIRELAGETNPEKAPPTSIRGKYGRIHSETKVFENVIHCSDSPENAEREIALWFKKDEVVE
ncbi:MAG: nucleoside-diphosphate kinase [Candidatus Pacearchaeota archaeon]|nr:nucleoside-diphosphate kinase [Candidatus Pacearchaeota archaeon]